MNRQTEKYTVQGLGESLSTGASVPTDPHVPPTPKLPEPPGSRAPIFTA